MSRTNRFIKLLWYEVGQEYVMVYGFSTCTEQDTKTWRCYNNHGNIVCRAILSEMNAADFERKLTKPGTIVCGKRSFPSPVLTPRPVVLSEGNLSGEDGPHRDGGKLTELWNYNKTDIFNKIVSNAGKCKAVAYRGARSIFNWVKEESGVCLIKNGHRLGNFEHYEPLDMAYAFDVTVDKECGLQKAVVKCRSGHLDPLIVNLTAVNGRRTVLNQTKILQPDIDSICFEAAEPMGYIIVQVWNADNANLVYKSTQALMRTARLKVNLSEPSLRLQDRWTKKLKKSDPGKAEVITQSVETVSRVNAGESREMKSPAMNEIDIAINEGRELMKPYFSSKNLGNFIPAGEEIDSFLKVKEYIDQDSINKVIIADPYFSARAAEKLLCRISHTGLRIEILSSLAGRDPDTGSSADYRKIHEQIKNFTDVNKAILHKNLLICDFKRGSGQVFHDRFLIRYFKNGTVDGFLMSNSLNSMGSKYPFTIAPLGHEVCLDVCDYLQDLRDGNIRDGGGEIKCEVLYDSAAVKAPQATPDTSVLEETGWLSSYYNENGQLNINEENIESAVTLILNHWVENKNTACSVLAEFASKICCNLFSPLIDVICKNRLVHTSEIAAEFTILAKEREKEVDFTVGGIGSDLFVLRKLLKGEAEPSVLGFEQMLEQAGHIFYGGCAWLSSGYRLMLALDRQCFFNLLDEIRSPLMFDTLASYMLFSPFDESLYMYVVRSKSIPVRLLGAGWLFTLAARGSIDNDSIFSIFEELDDSKDVLQLSYMLSVLTFHLRLNHADGQLSRQLTELRTWCLARLGSRIAACEGELRLQAYSLLDDCETCSKASMYYELAKNIAVPDVSRETLERAVSILSESLKDFSYDKDVNDQLELYLSCQEALGISCEDKQLHFLAKTQTLEAAAEPVMWEYNYTKWQRERIAATRQLALLRLYLKQHPESESVRSTVDKWWQRIVIEQ